MHLRKLTFTVGLIGALCSTWVYGLGLGEITLKSSLNQPLDAEIKLLQVRNLSEQDVLVELAAVEDFQRFGVDRIFFLHNLKFDVQLDHPDGPIVKVTTNEPVREPYLIFLLKAESPSGGRLLREYTLLMDLPVYAEEAASPVQAAHTRSEPQAPQNRPEPQQAPAQPAQPRQQAQSSPQLEQAQAQPVQPAPRAAEPPRAPQRSVSAGSGVEVYGPVQANDTLWEIAKRVRPDSGISIQQTMLALQRANPDAFINGNINLLKRGQVLRVPKETEFQALDRRAAISEVALQNEQWTAARQGQASGAELQASSSRPVAPSTAQAPRGQLTLAAPGDAQSAGERSGAGDASARTEALENELAIASEELDSTRRENQELNSRVAELEAQIATMERLIQVSNEELRAMQLAAEQRQAAANDAAAATATTAATATDAAANAGTDDPTVGTDTSATQETSTTPETATTSPADNSDSPPAEQSAPADQPVPAPQTASATDTPAPQPVAQPDASRVVVTQQATPQQSLMDLLIANLWYLLIAVLAILGGVAYFLHRRGQEAELDAYDEEVGEDIFASMHEEPMDDDYLNESTDFDESPDENAEEEPGYEEESDEFELEAPVEAETGDAVAEADIYIAYGKFDRAEEMLQKAILNEPNNLDARLKLMEVYSLTKDLDQFDREYGQLMAVGDADARARAAELRNGIPGAGPFADGDEAVGEAFSSTGGSLSDESFELDDSDISSELSFGTKSFQTEAFETDPFEKESSEKSDPDSTSHQDLGSPTSDQDQGSTLDQNDFSDLTLDLDDDTNDFSLAMESDGKTDGSKASDKDDDAAFDFDLDLVSEDDEASASSEATDSADDEAGEFDLSDEFALLDEPASDTLGGLSFTDVTADGTKTAESLSEEFSLAEEDDQEADDPAADFDLSLDLDLDEDSRSSTEDDIFSDLAFSAGSADALDTTPIQPANGVVGDDSDDSDDFNIDLGDLDLEALDQEMHALVGDMDDLDDDDVAMAVPTETMPALDEQTAEAMTAPVTSAPTFGLDQLTDAGLDESDAAATRQQASADIADLDTAEEEEDTEPTFSFDANQTFDEEGNADEDLDDELDFLTDADEVATKLDLARAYIDMGDQDGARDILDEVTSEGSDEQKREAAELLEKIV